MKKRMDEPARETISFRFPTLLVERLDALGKAIQERDRAIVAPTRTEMILLAVSNGLEVLERDMREAKLAKSSTVKRKLAKKP